jgi:propanol-preferring alcohol dehydrogenase
MKAMLLENSGSAESRPLALSDVEAPVPAADELGVRVRACGVCRTDLHVVEGDLPPARRPIVPGHEVVGTIDRLGSGVRGFQLGERVGIAWLRATCGRCEFCREGRTNLCPNARFTGYHEHGGYAEHAVVPAEYAYRIPAAFGDDEAAPLLCAGIIGYRALKRSGVKSGERLGLYGFGGSAHIVIQIARARGCEVFVCSLAPSIASSRASSARPGSAKRTRRRRGPCTDRSCSRRRASSSRPRCARCDPEARWLAPASTCRPSPPSTTTASSSAKGRCAA